MEEDHVLYIRGRVSRVVQDGDVLKVYGADTLSGQRVVIDADLVVLATAIVAGADPELGQNLRAPTDANGFFQELHPKLRPMETLTAGVFLAGNAQAPKDIPDTVAQASGSAAKVLEILSRPQLEREPTVARVDPATCTGCFDCERVCPYGAIGRHEIHDRQGNLLRTVAEVNPAMCEGCGICTSTCRVRSIDVLGFDDEQTFAQLGALGAREPVLVSAP
jgi:heterodisulfide reductase subunit A2